MGTFDGIFNNKPQQAAAGYQIAGLQNGQESATKDINTGLADANSTYASGLTPFTTNLTQDQAGQGAYGDATGANGAAGYAKALQSFNDNPGQAYQLQVAKDQVMRSASQTGSEASGGTLMALSDRAQGIAQQNWQQYITNLLPFVGASTANATGQVPLVGAQAGTQYDAGKTKGNLDYSTATGIGNANANATLSQINTNGNIVNAGMQGAKLATNLMAFL